MSRFRIFLKSFLASPRAATAIEYSLIAGGIALAIAAVVFTLGDTVFVELYAGLADIIGG